MAAAQTARGAGPQHAVAIAEQRANVVARHAVGLAKPVEMAVVHPVQAAAFGADPEIALRIFRQSAHEIGREAVLHCEELPLPPVPARQTALATNPNPAGTVLVEGADFGIRRADGLLRTTGTKRPSCNCRRPPNCVPAQTFASRSINTDFTPRFVRPSDSPKDSSLFRSSGQFPAQNNRSTALPFDPRRPIGRWVCSWCLRARRNLAFDPLFSGRRHQYTHRSPSRSTHSDKTVSLEGPCSPAPGRT